MSITIGGKEYLSYEEQILENKRNIENLEPKIISSGQIINFGQYDEVRTFIVLPTLSSDEGYSLDSKIETTGGTYKSHNINVGDIVVIGMLQGYYLLNKGGNNNVPIITSVYPFKLIGGDYNLILKEL